MKPELELGQTVYWVSKGYAGSPADINEIVISMIVLEQKGEAKVYRYGKPYFCYPREHWYTTKESAGEALITAAGEAVVHAKKQLQDREKELLALTKGES